MTVADALRALGPGAHDAGPPPPNLALIDRLIVPMRAGELPGRAAIQTRPGSDAVTAVTILFADLDTTPARRAEIFAELKRQLIE